MVIGLKSEEFIKNVWLNKQNINRKCTQEYKSANPDYVPVNIAGKRLRGKNFMLEDTIFEVMRLDVPVNEFIMGGIFIRKIRGLL